MEMYIHYKSLPEGKTLTDVVGELNGRRQVVDGVEQGAVQVENNVFRCCPTRPIPWPPPSLRAISPASLTLSRGRWRGGPPSPTPPCSTG